MIKIIEGLGEKIGVVLLKVGVEIQGKNRVRLRGF